MTHRDDEKDVLYVVEEPPGKCELCGAVEETRPYGPGGAQVCFGCGKKDEEEMKRQFEAFAEGKPPPDPLPGRTKP